MPLQYFNDLFQVFGIIFVVTKNFIGLQESQYEFHINNDRKLLSYL